MSKFYKNGNIQYWNNEFRWYFTETSRRDAERFLEQPHNGKGTFLIRPSDTNQGMIKLI
jgi:hypothetical protein